MLMTTGDLEWVTRNIPCLKTSGYVCRTDGGELTTVKGSVLTTRTWFLLIGAALLISAGFLNFRQRAKHETPAWDGVDWVDTSKGVVAKSIERNSAGERAWLLPGDHLLGVSLDPNAKSEEIAHARDVQIYLDQAARWRSDSLPDGKALVSS